MWVGYTIISNGAKMNHRITPEYWMRMAVEIAKASSCRANVGCILVHKNQIVGHGYVGSISGDVHCVHETEPEHHILVKTDMKGSTKTGTTCIRTVHAEVNAALKCTVRGSKENGWISCYCTYQPCMDCLKVLLQIGVRNIYYLNPYKDELRDIFIEECHLMYDKRNIPDDRADDYAKFIQVPLMRVLP